LKSLRRAAGFFQFHNRNRSTSFPGLLLCIQMLLGLANLVAERGLESCVLPNTQQRAVHGAGLAAGDESSVIAAQVGFDRLWRVAISDNTTYIIDASLKRCNYHINYQQRDICTQKDVLKIIFS
jgi:hypothetical protein